MPTRTVESLTDSSATPAPQTRLQRLQGYLQTDPTNVALLGDVSDLALQQGQWESAKDVLHRWLALTPGDAAARYRLAVAERATGNAAAAQPLLSGLVAEGHKHHAVLLELARAEAQLGAWAAVLSALDLLDVASAPPEEADAAWLLRVRAQHHLGEVAAAIASAEAWQADRGGKLPTLGLAALATLRLDAEQLDAAEALLATAGADVVSQNAELGAAAGFIALSHGQAQVAEAHLSRAAAQQPGLGRAHLGLGLSAAYAGDLPRAVAALHAATMASPSHLGSWHALAWMQMLSNDLVGAEASLRAALSQDANFGETHGGLALLAALRGDQETAEQHLRTATRLDARGVNVAVARVALQQGAGAMDSRILAPALERFMGLAAMQSPGMLDLVARMAPRK